MQWIEFLSIYLLCQQAVLLKMRTGTEPFLIIIWMIGLVCVEKKESNFSHVFLFWWIEFLNLLNGHQIVTNLLCCPWEWNPLRSCCAKFLTFFWLSCVWFGIDWSGCRKRRVFKTFPQFWFRNLLVQNNSKNLQNHGQR